MVITEIYRKQRQFASNSYPEQKISEYDSQLGIDVKSLSNIKTNYHIPLLSQMQEHNVNRYIG